MVPEGFRLLPAYLSPALQVELMAAVFAAAEQAPFRHQTTRGGKAMSVATTAMGPLGWTSDARGYRYEPAHDRTGRPFPAIPAAVARLWAELADPHVPADSCLVNLYRGGARMGLHQDVDEADFRFPVLSISLGDTAVFRLGGATRNAPTRSFRLASGDVVLLAGAARRAFHGVDRILPGSSRLTPGGGRINLTLRRARSA
jgi:DNA oxidative demethylase